MFPVWSEVAQGGEESRCRYRRPLVRTHHRKPFFQPKMGRPVHDDRRLRFCRNVAVIMQRRISLNFWAVPVLFLNTVVSTLYISNDTKNLTTHGRALSCRLALGLLVRNSGRRIFDRRKVVRQCRLPPTNQRGGPATGKRGRSHRKKSPRRPGSWGSLNRMRLRP